ncbi:MAG: thiosulfate oxidation carrier complex protein SoxZ [Hyphomicrobiaceae bacterium]
MAAKPTPRVRMPSTAKKDEVIEVKTLISHEMETGLRKDSSGALIKRRIIKQFKASFNGKEVFRADWFPSVSANPYQSFFVRATESGTFTFEWFDDDGSIYKHEQKLAVS